MVSIAEVTERLEDVYLYEEYLDKHAHYGQIIPQFVLQYIVESDDSSDEDDELQQAVLENALSSFVFTNSIIEEIIKTHPDYIQAKFIEKEKIYWYLVEKLFTKYLALTSLKARLSKRSDTSTETPITSRETRDSILLKDRLRPYIHVRDDTIICIIKEYPIKFRGDFNLEGTPYHKIFIQLQKIYAELESIPDADPAQFQLACKKILDEAGQSSENPPEGKEKSVRFKDLPTYERSKIASAIVSNEIKKQILDIINSIDIQKMIHKALARTGEVVTPNNPFGSIDSELYNVLVRIVKKNVNENEIFEAAKNGILDGTLERRELRKFIMLNLWEEVNHCVHNAIYVRKSVTKQIKLHRKKLYILMSTLLSEKIGASNFIRDIVKEQIQFINTTFTVDYMPFFSGNEICNNLNKSYKGYIETQVYDVILNLFSGYDPNTMGVAFLSKLESNSTTMPAHVDSEVEVILTNMLDARMIDASINIAHHFLKSEILFYFASYFQDHIRHMQNLLPPAARASPSSSV